ncbi:MAG: 50S ribosomal protein L18 [Candidatus Aenigmatarchaeota archaeon]
MKHTPTYTMPFKRRRLGKTDYTNRLKLLTSKIPRLVVRRSSNYITAQIVTFEKVGDKTLVSASSQELKKLGWKFSTDNLPASYLTGMIIAKKAEKKGVKEVVLDSGLYASTKGNRIYAVVKGAIDGGLKIPVSEEILPPEDRIKGTHISKYQEKFKELPQEFEKIKGKI